MNCAHCSTPMTGRKRMYCDATCRQRAWAKMRKPSDRTCTTDGCTKPHMARGMCKTHYNAATRKPNPTVTVQCQWCGRDTVKERAGLNRYASTFCGLACRDQARRNAGPSSELPADHWARWYGATSTWTAPKTIPVRNTGECAWCGHHNPRASSAKYCSFDCKKRAQRVRRAALKHGTFGEYSHAQVVRLWLAFDQCCAYCAERTLLADIQAEHVVPLSKGGENHIGNLLPSCGPCNSDKRDLSLADWPADRARRGLAPVTTTWSPDDPRYHHLTPPRPPLTLAA